MLKNSIHKSTNGEFLTAARGLMWMKWRCLSWEFSVYLSGVMIILRRIEV